MNHLEFAAYESAQVVSSDPWLAWCDHFRALIGGDNDGDISENGYSLDESFDAFEAGQSAEQYAAKVTARPNFNARPQADA